MSLWARRDAVSSTAIWRERHRAGKQNIYRRGRSISRICAAKAPVCSTKSGVDAGNKSSRLDGGTIRMINDGQGTIFKQDKAGSDILDTRAMSQTATSGSCVRTIAFGVAPGFRSVGVDARSTLVGKDAWATFSLPRCKQRRPIGRNG